jgi:hypothetical protein
MLPERAVLASNGADGTRFPEMAPPSGRPLVRAQQKTAKIRFRLNYADFFSLEEYAIR